MTYACAIPPLDQSSTGLGWWPGLYRYVTPHVDGSVLIDYSLQFLADPGTPVVAPFPVRIVRPGVVRPTVELPYLGGVVLDIVVTDLAGMPAPGSSLQKGDLLGRIAPRSRGTKWVLWDASGQRSGIEALFGNLGLSLVGGTRPELPAYASTPNFGGHMYIRTGTPADCSSTTGMHGLKGLGALGAPTGYADTPPSVYGRYGPSGQHDTSIPSPHENRPTVRQAAGGGGLLLGLGLGLWWWLRNG